MVLSHLIGWPSHLAGADALIVGWAIVAGLILLLVVLSVVLVRLWPLSRRWARANRLHRVASRNEAGLRRGAQRQLDAALRTLEIARRSCVASRCDEDAAQIDHLARQVGVVRERVASDYVPSPANVPQPRRELDLDTLVASEAVASRCGELANRVRSGAGLAQAQLDEAERALCDVEERGLALP